VRLNLGSLHGMAFDPAGLMFAAPVAVKNGGELALRQLDASDKPRRMEKKKDDSTRATSTPATRA
jgi:hypothetical protein